MDTLDIAMLGLAVAIVAQIAYVVLLATGPWWRHFVGRALFSEGVVFAVVLTMTLVNNYVIYPYQLEVGACLMWGITLSIVYRLLAMLRQRRLARRQQRLDRSGRAD